MITTQRAALAAIRKHGYLNEFFHPADGFFAVGAAPGITPGPGEEECEVAASIAWRLIDAGRLRREGGGEACAWYRCSSK